MCPACAAASVLQRKGPKGKRTGLDKMAKQELRMMKNRESAARSRARRQQHTVQLEQENEDLRAQVQDLQTTAERLREQVGLQDSPRAAYQLPTHQLLHS